MIPNLREVAGERHMKRNRPFIRKTRDEFDGKRWKQLGPASGLLEFLESWRSSGGAVRNNAIITYAWIRSQIPNAPTQRTLERWMRRLKKLGEVEVESTFWGMKIRLLGRQNFEHKISAAKRPRPARARFGGSLSEENRYLRELIRLNRNGAVGAPAKKTHTWQEAHKLKTENPDMSWPDIARRVDPDTYREKGPRKAGESVRHGVKHYLVAGAK